MAAGDRRPRELLARRRTPAARPPASSPPTTTRGSCWPTCSASTGRRLAAGRRRRRRRRPRQYDALVARRAAREPLQHLTGVAALPPRRAQGRPGCLRAAAGDRAARRLGDRGGRGRSTARRSSSTSAPARAPSPRRSSDEVPPARVHAVELDERAHAWAARNLAGTGVDLRQGDLARRVRRPRRDRRRGGQQPALHPARGLGVGGRRGA